MNSKQWKPCINCTLYIDTRLLGKHTISSDSSKQVHKEPSHGAFAPLYNALEHLVDMYPLVLAYTQKGAVHKADTCTLALENLLDDHYQWDGNLTFQFNETVDYRLPLSRLTSLNIGCRRPPQETDGACACIPFRDRNASSSDTLMNERESLSPWFPPLTCGFHCDICASFLP